MYRSFKPREKDQVLHCGQVRRAGQLRDFINHGILSDAPAADPIDTALAQALSELGEQKRVDRELEDAAYEARRLDELVRQVQNSWSDLFTKEQIQTALVEVGLDVDAATELLLNSPVQAQVAQTAAPTPCRTHVQEMQETIASEEVAPLPAPHSRSRRGVHPDSVINRRFRDQVAAEDFWAKRKLPRDQAMNKSLMREAARKAKGRQR